MGAAYMVASWLLLQIVDVLVPMLGLPDWVGKLVFLFLFIGLIPTLVFSWAYEMTPDGLKRDSEVIPDQSITHQTAKKLDGITIVLVLIVAGIVVIDRFIPEMAEQPVIEEPSASESIKPKESPAAVDERQSVAV